MDDLKLVDVIDLVIVLILLSIDEILWTNLGHLLLLFEVNEHVGADHDATVLSFETLQPVIRYHRRKLPHVNGVSLVCPLASLVIGVSLG